MLTAIDIARMVNKKPFEPFRLHVTDGASYDVRHPEFVMVGPNHLYVFVPMPNHPFPIFERYDIVGLAHVTRLEPIIVSPSPTAN